MSANFTGFTKATIGAYVSSQLQIISSNRDQVRAQIANVTLAYDNFMFNCAPSCYCGDGVKYWIQCACPTTFGPLSKSLN